MVDKAIVQLRDMDITIVKKDDEKHIRRISIVEKSYFTFTNENLDEALFVIRVLSKLGKKFGGTPELLSKLYLLKSITNVTYDDEKILFIGNASIVDTVWNLSANFIIFKLDYEYILNTIGIKDIICKVTPDNLLIKFILFNDEVFIVDKYGKINIPKKYNNFYEEVLPIVDKIINNYNLQEYKWFDPKQPLFIEKYDVDGILLLKLRLNIFDVPQFECIMNYTRGSYGIWNFRGPMSTKCTKIVEVLMDYNRKFDTYIKQVDDDYKVIITTDKDYDVDFPYVEFRKIDKISQ